MPADSCKQSDSTSPIFTSEMTYIVSSGALNSTHSLTHADLHALSSLLQKGGHPPHNDVRQTQSSTLGDQHVVVNMVKCFGEINENRVHRLALVDGDVPVV